MSENEKNLLYESRRKIAFRAVAQTAAIAAGVACAVLGLNHFVVPHGILDGGVIGAALLFAHGTGLSVAPLIFLFNLPILALAYVKIGRRFAIRALAATAVFAAVQPLVPVRMETDDALLSAIFGGCLLGAGSGFALRAASVLDGSEILALLLSRRAGVQLGEIVLAFNIVIFAVAGAVLGVEKALYSMVTYFCAARMMEFVLHGFEEYNAVTIISARSESVREAILRNTDR
ncbi:MAG: YitT family protein, partial [Bacteroidia bacterium]|nr:YitT family protein [Bacteroidia bacterium]MDW8334405.1 YitT family protein [Bacteroidia bacterium]